MLWTARVRSDSNVWWTRLSKRVRFSLKFEVKKQTVLDEIKLESIICTTYTNWDSCFVALHYRDQFSSGDPKVILGTLNSYRGTTRET